jgi:predicted enzyme related to lactoylglutathione lyase
VDLNSIMIGSEDPGRLVDYYTKVLGKPAWNEGGYTGWQIGSGSIWVGPHDAVQGKNAQPGRLIWNIETPGVKEEFDRMVAAGARVIREPYTPDVADTEMLVCTFADPDDNYFQLASPMG